MASTEAARGRPPRPLSPHLNIYQFTLTMAMSIAASHHRRRALCRRAAAGLVPHRRLDGRRRLSRVSRPSSVVLRPADPVRLHLGAVPPHARRHPPPDLGRRLRAGRAGARLCAWGTADRRPGADRLVWASATPSAEELPMSGKTAGLRTPSTRVRFLGSSQKGTAEAWMIHVTGLAIVVLGPLRLARAPSAAHGLQRRARDARPPIPAILLLAFIVAGMSTWRSACARSSSTMSRSARGMALMVNTCFCALLALACVYATLRISLA